MSRIAGRGTQATRRITWATIALAFAFCTLLAVSRVDAADAAKDSGESRPSWCHTGYVCVPTSELADDAEYHLQLREQVLRYKRRAQRFGLTVGPGIGVGSVVTSEYDVHWVGTAGFFMVYGFRW